jgi:AraC-like DNA-binding protein
VEAAKQLMTVRGLPLSKIAISAGFANQSHFTRVFSAAVDVSSGAWRREAHGRWLGTETRRNPGLNEALQEAGVFPKAAVSCPILRSIPASLVNST